LGDFCIGNFKISLLIASLENFIGVFAMILFKIDERLEIMGPCGEMKIDQSV